MSLACTSSFISAGDTLRVDDSTSDGAGDVEAGVQLGVAAPDRAQPAGVHRSGVHRLPGQVVVPLAAVGAVDGHGVEAVDPSGDRLLRPPGAQSLDRHPGGRAAQPRRALHVEPRGVEHHPGHLGGAALVGPQGEGQAAGRVSGRDHLGVPVTPGDAPPGEVELGEVLAEVADVVGGLVVAQRPAVLAQVDGVERVAALGPPLGVLGVEEVVGEAVHVQHRAAGGPAGRQRHEGGDHRAFVVRREGHGLDPVGRSEDVGLRLGWHGPRISRPGLPRGRSARRRVFALGLGGTYPRLILRLCRTPSRPFSEGSAPTSSSRSTAGAPAPAAARSSSRASCWV